MTIAHRVLVSALFIPLWATSVATSGSEAVRTPTVFHPPFRVEVDGQPLDTGAVGGHCGPCVFDVNGDDLDDLVVGDFSGTFRILRNVGAAGAPRFVDGGRLEAGGAFAKVWIYCCVASQPRFCDLDGDGLEDMLANSYDPGHCHFFKALPDGDFAAGVELTDVSGAPVRACPAQTKKVDSFGSFFEPVDWDDDGDLDLLIGCFDGGLKLRLNTGTARAPAFGPDNVVVETAAGPLTVPRHCCPNVADYDGDGRLDLIVGDCGDDYDFKPDLTPEQKRACEDLFAAYRAASDKLSRKKSELSSGVDPEDREAGERAGETLANSPEHAEFLRVAEAFKEGIRPHLRSTHQAVEIREDGTKQRYDQLTRRRGSVWVYLRDTP